jgi:5-methylcytosine-specific restriction endonuclease McrA
MSAAQAKLVLQVIRTDREAQLTDAGWVTKCLFCRKALVLSADGKHRGGASLEHIVPRSWFDHRAAADLIETFEGPNDLRNLALACRSCNSGKGSGHDANGPLDFRAREIVTALLEKRAARYIDPVEE